MRILYENFEYIILFGKIVYYQILHVKWLIEKKWIKKYINKMINKRNFFLFFWWAWVINQYLYISVFIINCYHKVTIYFFYIVKLYRKIYSWYMNFNIIEITLLMSQKMSIEIVKL